MPGLEFGELRPKKAAESTSVRMRFGLRRARHLGENGAVLAHILGLSYDPETTPHFRPKQRLVSRIILP
jgi:hypothetical protein